MFETISSEDLANRLGALVRETGGDGLTTPDYIAEKLPDLEWTPQVAGVVALLGRSPFPSINGPYPVYASRPFYDARRVEASSSESPHPNEPQSPDAPHA